MEADVKYASINMSTGELSFSVDVKCFNVEYSDWCNIENQVAKKLGCESMAILMKKIAKFLKD